MRCFCKEKRKVKLFVIPCSATFASNHRFPVADMLLHWETEVCHRGSILVRVRMMLYSVRKGVCVRNELRQTVMIEVGESRRPSCEKENISQSKKTYSWSESTCIFKFVFALRSVSLKQKSSCLAQLLKNTSSIRQRQKSLAILK